MGPETENEVKKKYFDDCFHVDSENIGLTVFFLFRSDIFFHVDYEKNGWHFRAIFVAFS